MELEKDVWNFRQIKMDEISKREDSLFEHVSKLIEKLGNM